MSTLFLLALIVLQPSAAVQSQNSSVSAQLRESSKPAKLIGHVSGLKDLAALPVTLHDPTGAALQTRAAADGSFEFESVPLGSYTLRAPGFTTIDLVIDSSNLNVELRPMYSGPGVPVSGKVIDKSAGLQSATTRTVTLSPLFSGPNVTGGISALGGALGTVLTSTLEAWVRPNGTFEFPSVPAGSYMLRSLPAAPATSRRVEIAESDVRNLDIVIPFQFETTGRVLLEGRDLGPNATVQATQPTFTSATGIQSDGSFKLRLTEGENEVSMARLPVEFAVKKISFGSADITHRSLKVDPTTKPQEIVITLENVSLDSLPGVKVSGRLVTSSGQPAFGDNPLRLSPAEPGGRSLEAIAKPDGTFEFPKVTPGIYWLQGVVTSSRTQISVAHAEIKDIEIVVPSRTIVAGRIVVVDGEGKASPFRPHVSMVFRLPNTGFSATGVKADGTFSMPLADNEYTATVANLPEGYVIKSIASGPINLLENPLRVDSKRVPDNIEVVLEFKPGLRR
jgi:hypothetical protein